MANYGNLGGPVIDVTGAVVGMVVMLGPSDERPWLINSGVGLFVDSATLRQVLPGLLRGENAKAMRTLGMGVSIENDPSRENVTIKAVLPGTGAADAELEGGDVIVSVDGHAVHRLEEVTRLLVRHHAGDHVTVVVNRDGTELVKQVELRPFGEAKP
jgi:S1-C subfamily serine protease